MKKAKKVSDKPSLYGKLKAKAAKLGLEVVGHVVTSQGVGIAYSKELKVYAYAKNLREAVLYELRVLDGKEDRPVRVGKKDWLG